MEELYCNSRKVEKIYFKKIHSFYVRDTNSSALDIVFMSLYLFTLSTSHILYYASQITLTKGLKSLLMYLSTNATSHVKHW